MVYEKCYYEKSTKFSKSNDSFDDCSLKLEKILLDAVEEQLISDVEIGSFLSGGIDSSLISALMAKVSKKRLILIQLVFITTNLTSLSILLQYRITLIQIIISKNLILVMH